MFLYTHIFLSFCLVKIIRFHLSWIFSLELRCETVSFCKLFGGEMGGDFASMT